MLWPISDDGISNKLREELHSSQQAQEAELRKIVDTAFEKFTAVYRADIRTLRDEIRAIRGEPPDETASDAMSSISTNGLPPHAGSLRDNHVDCSHPMPVSRAALQRSGSSSHLHAPHESRAPRNSEGEMGAATAAEQAVHAEQLIAQQQSREVFGNHNTSVSLQDAGRRGSLGRMQMDQEKPRLILLPNSRFRLVWDIITCLLSARQSALSHAHLACSLRATPHVGHEHASSPATSVSSFPGLATRLAHSAKLNQPAGAVQRPVTPFLLKRSSRAPPPHVCVHIVPLCQSCSLPYLCRIGLHSSMGGA